LLSDDDICYTASAQQYGQSLHVPSVLPAQILAHTVCDLRGLQMGSHLTDLQH